MFVLTESSRAASSSGFRSFTLTADALTEASSGSP
ncbi:hypothetical protein PC116_g16614 [Phytophthora cactorum]|nr:hypothetical protein PC128_g25440 [Phytophthora cactorum]KAG4235266.1 hypothetical protein PC116_g16614 [Phytophthora cactorum]